MSKLQKEKVIVNFEETPLLGELGFKELVKKFDTLHILEKEAVKDVARINEKRKAVGVELQAAVEAVAADSVQMVSGKVSYRATLVKAEAGTRLDESKLQFNLMTMAKLDAGVIARVLAASQVPTKAREPYMLVTTEAL